MKQKTFLFCMLCLSFGILTSCNDSDNDNELYKHGTLIIDPVDEPMFQFDEQGIPYRLNHPTLSQQMQQDLQNEFIGYGWKWMQTFDIQDDGHIKAEDYYKERIGWNPSSYYIKSDKVLVKYFCTDDIPALAYLTQGYSMETATGTLFDSYNPSGIHPWSIYLRIWSIYQLSGRWYIDTIEPLGLKREENGELKTVWGCSHYYRMSETELKQMQKEYTFDYSMIN